MTTPVCPSYAGYRFPAEVISHAVWLYFRFPLSLRMVEEMLAGRGIIVSHETIRQWALKFGQDFANRIRRRLPSAALRRRQMGACRKVFPRTICEPVALCRTCFGTTMDRNSAVSKPIP